MVLAGQDYLRLFSGFFHVNLDNQIETWRDNYDGEDDPEAYFENLKSALVDYKQEFKGNEVSCIQINDAIESIDRLVEELKSEYVRGDDGFFSKSDADSAVHSDTRSIFDDVDI